MGFRFQGQIQVPEFEAKMAAAKNQEETLTLVSSDDKRFEVSMEAALMSKLVRSILEGDSNAKKIPIKKLKGDILGLIVKYMKYHNGKKPEEIAKPLCFEMKDNVADKWDAEYIDAMKKETIYQVILGANYMDIPSLLHLGCAKIATVIKGQSLKDIKSVMTMNQQKTKRRAVILYEHWQCSEGKPLDANLQNVVFEHYAGGFEFDPKLCHKTLKLSNGNKTVTMTTNESANVYSKNMICSKRMARLQWELTLKAKLDAVKGDCMMGILDAKHIKNVDTSKMFADGGVAIGVSIGHNGSLWAHKGKGGGQEVYASTPQWNIGDRLMLDFDLKRRRCTVFLNDQLQGTLKWNLPESFFCVANVHVKGTALETTRFECVH